MSAVVPLDAASRRPAQARLFDLASDLLPFGIALACFTSTLAPGILGGDAGELQFVPAILSLTHPTGYPLQTLLDRLWVMLVPFGSVAWRTNLLSALVGAGGAALVSSAVRRSTGSRIAGLTAATALLIAPVYWGQAVLGDKYALNGLLTALLILAAWRFWDRPRNGTLGGLAFAAGLGLAHHRGFLAFGPPLVVLVAAKWWHMPRRAQALFVGLTAVVIPLLLYLYVPWASQRGLPPYLPRIANWSEFLRYLRDPGFATQIGWMPNPDNLRYYIATLGENFGAVLLVLAGMGLALRAGCRRRPGWLAFLAAAFLLQAYLTQNYDVPRRFVFFIPGYVCASSLIGEGVAGLLGLLRPSENGLRRPWHPAVLGAASVVFLILPLSGLPRQWRAHWVEQRVEVPLDLFRQDLKTGRQADRLAAAAAHVRPRAMIVGDPEQATPLYYAQQVDGRCSDCSIRAPLDKLIDFVGQAQAEDRPLYVARTVNQAADWSEPTAEGPLVHLAAVPDTRLPAGLVPVGLTFDGNLRLAGYAWPLGAPALRPGTVLPISLIWQGGSQPSPDYSISVRLAGPTGVIWQGDSSAPVLGMHPFGRLETGQVIADYHEVPLAPGLRPGRYALLVLLYRMLPGGQFVNAQPAGGDGSPPGESATLLSFDIGAR